MATIQDNDLSHSIVGTTAGDLIFAAGGSDVVRGGGGDDIIFGESGDDVLFGDENNDILLGGTGQDTMDGGTGTDTVDYSGESFGVVVDLSINFGGNPSGAGFDTLKSIENVFATNASDTIFGSSANNKILGLNGNDVIAGKFGSDTMTGGGGADKFSYSSASESLPGSASHDIITDFVHGVDKIDLHSIDAVQSLTGDQAFKFIGTGNFGFEGDLRVVFTNGNTLIQGNTDTDSTPEFEIQLSGLHTISSTDFTL